MRLISTTIAIAALLTSGAAVAAEGKEAGKSGASGTQPGGESPGGGKATESIDSRDKPTDTTFSTKTWEVSAGIEYHHLFSTYTNNAGERNVNYYSVGAKWDPSPYDRLSVKYGVYQSFLSDVGETGVRSDDIIFTYTRRFPLPAKVNLRASFSLTAPVSYASQLAGLYTSPRLSIQADKRFGRYFTLDGRVSGSLYPQKYAVGGFSYTGGGISEGNVAVCNSGSGLGCNGGGGNPSTKAALSMNLVADFAMPFHEPLSVGAGGYVAWSWNYNVCGSTSVNSMHEGSFGMPLAMGNCNLPADNASYTQPYVQHYGYEIYAHYALPNFGGFKSDFQFTWAPLGDTTLGYYNPQRNGATQWYGQFFSLNEFYLSLSGRY